MPKYTAIINYDSLEAYQEHGSKIEQIAKDHFASKGATEQAGFFSTRSMPPSHRTTFVVPEGISVEELKGAELPGGVRCDVKEA